MSDLYQLHRLTVTAPGEALFAALAAQVQGLSRHQAREAIMGGLVKIDGEVVLDVKTPLGAKAKIELDLRHGIKRALRTRIHDLAPAGKPFTILYEDRQVLVVDKAPGVLSAPSKSRGLGEGPERGHLPELIRRAIRRQQRELDFLGVVHRLDKDTSGCICFGLTRDAQRALSAQFAGQAAGRIYRAITMGQPRRDEDRLEGRLGRGEDGRRAVVEEDEDGKESVTSFRVLRRMVQGAELQVALETGRTHQIRIMLADIACPVYGDRLYGFRPRKGQPLPPKAPRLMLHAEELAFDHPLTGKRITVNAPLPPEFASFATTLDQPPEAPEPWGDAPLSEPERPVRRPAGRAIRATRPPR